MTIDKASELGKVLAEALGIKPKEDGGGVQ